MGTRKALPFDEAQFDTVVCTLALCTIPMTARRLREAWRVLRPGGRLVLLEHVRSPARRVRIGQELLGPLLLCLLHDHLLREPADVIERAGFVIEELERWKLGIVERLSAHESRPAGA